MEESHGFTFIELSVVLAILGILACIAVPQYSKYREKLYDKTVIHDLHEVAAAQEKFFAAHQSYKNIDNCIDITAKSKCPIEDLPGVTSLSKGVALTMNVSPDGFVATARHVKASKVCTWDSTKGGFIGCL